MFAFLALPALLWSGLGKLFMGLFNFFTTKPGCYLGIALLVLAAFWYTDHRAYQRGYDVHAQEEAGRIADAQLAAYQAGIERQKGLQRGLMAAAWRAGWLRGKAKANTITLTKEVPVYVTAETDRLFPVPCGLLRVHDAAAQGVTAASLGDRGCGPDGAPSLVKASELGQLIVENYGLDHEKDATILGLQDVVRTLVKAMGATLEITQIPVEVGKVTVSEAQPDAALDKPNADGQQEQAVEDKWRKVSFHQSLNGPSGP